MNFHIHSHRPFSNNASGETSPTNELAPTTFVETETSGQLNEIFRPQTYQDNQNGFKIQYPA
jgi:hypothetical protein